MKKWIALALAGIFALGIGEVQAAERTVPPSDMSMKMSFAPIVKRVAPAVVNVYASRTVDVPTSPLMTDPFFRQFFGDRIGGTEKRQQNSLGSGVIVGSDGLIVTNNHVIDKATDIKVALTDRRQFDAEVVLKDSELDLAVLKIKDLKEALPIVEIGDSDSLQVGDLVLAIGDPFGVGQTVTSGIVSALARSEVGVSDYQFFIQTDAAINPGNSGGALIDMDGRLVGINSAIYSSSGGSNGIGFAIPANMVKVALQSAAHGGKRVELPWVGADMTAVTADMAEALGLDRPLGLLVQSVVEGSPAAKAGLVAGDVVTRLDGQEVSELRVMNYKLAAKGIGNFAELTVLRKGKAYQAKLQIAPPQETVPRTEVTIGGTSPFQGLTIANLSPRVAADLGLAYHGEQGVVVTRVDEQGLAAEAGFAPGDVILQVNRIKITTTADLQKAADARPDIWQIIASRDGQIMRFAFRG